MRTRKTWAEKLADDKDLPKVASISRQMSRRRGRGTVVTPVPWEVDALMRKVPRGKLITISQIRAAFAVKHRATIGCPITAGIFAWIAGHAAAEQAAAGKRKTAPYRRTLKTGGQVNDEYPGGAPAERKRLAAEGHRTVRKGGHSYVADFKRVLWALPAV